MPQASDEDRAKYRERFGGIDCNHAINELVARGYVLTKDWEWLTPTPEHEPTDEELSWICFLVDEWDFGSWAPPEARVAAPKGEEPAR